MADKNFKSVNRAVPKKDAMAIMGGRRVYTDDLVPPGALVVKLVRSPYALAEIISVDKAVAEKVPGVECIMTYEDVPKTRFSIAGASYPGNNPFDRRILDRWVRFVGDPAAIVVAETEEAAEKAARLIKIKYDVKEPIIDFEKAEGAASVIHPEDDFVFQCDIGGDLKKNILSYSEENGPEDFEKVYGECPVTLDETYYTQPTQQSMMETFRTYSYYDEYGRLTLVSSTQVTFHARRIVAHALELPQGMVRVIKPRIGGGFGAKQTMGTEVYAAAATWKTGKLCYCRFTRQETSAYTNTRHEMRIRVRMGAEKDGTVKALWVDTLANAGAYSEHSVNVIGLSGHKSIPLFGKADAWRFTAKNVFTDTEPAGAFRGFGATQGCFAVEMTANRLAETLGMDPTELRLRNLPEVGKPMSAYYNETLLSCTADKCIEKGKKMIGWDEKYDPRPFSHEVAPGKYRGLGMAVTMQGSGIAGLDNVSASVRLENTGAYSLGIGASDMGTGCDTILAQMAAEKLQCGVEDITVSGVDTASSPYDKGSYASATTFLTGNAVVIACERLLEKMKRNAAVSMEVPEDTVSFDGRAFVSGDRKVTVAELGRDSINGQNEIMSASASFGCKKSPPPFAVAFAEVEVDTKTGKVDLTDLAGVIDCGTVINTALARVQAEGGYAQGAGMALYEQSGYTDEGKLINAGFMQYKIPAREDIPKIRIEFEESYEPLGPFGAKSIGEVVMNPPIPAIVSAIKNAVGAEIKSLPATPEKVWRALRNK